MAYHPKATDAVAATMLTIKDLMKRWDLSRGTLRAWNRDGHGPPLVRLGPRCCRYRLADVVRHESGKTGSFDEATIEELNSELAASAPAVLPPDPLDELLGQ